MGCPDHVFSANFVSHELPGLAFFRVASWLLAPDVASIALLACFSFKTVGSDLDFVHGAHWSYFLREFVACELLLFAVFFVFLRVSDLRGRLHALPRDFLLQNRVAKSNFRPWLPPNIFFHAFRVM